MPDRGRRIHRPPAFDAAGTLVGGSGLTRAGSTDRIQLLITNICAHKRNNYLILTRVSSLTYTPCGVSLVNVEYEPPRLVSANVCTQSCIHTKSNMPRGTQKGAHLRKRTGVLIGYTSLTLNISRFGVLTNFMRAAGPRV